MKYLTILFILIFGIAFNLKAQNYITEVKNYHQAVIYYQNGMEKYQSGSLDSAKINLEKAVELFGDHPTIIYNLAAVNSKLNNIDIALSSLKRLADMKLIFHPENDSDFASLFQNKKFKNLVTEFQNNSNEISNAETAFKLEEKDLITEGVAYHKKSKSFFISSVNKKKIIKIDSLGKVTDFIKEGEYKIFGVLGISVDNSRDILWATTAVPESNNNFNFADVGKSGIYKFNLKTGKLIESYFAEDQNCFFGDLFLTDNGDVFVSDSKGKGIYVLRSGSSKLSEFIPKENFISPQGITISSNGKYIFLADYALGIFRIDLQTKNIKLIKTPENICALGVDGLYFYKNSLIAVQNGVNPNRVIKFKLDENYNKILDQHILEANTEFVDDPTLGVILKEQFYFIANSQWNKIDKNGNALPLEKWDEPVILKIDLGKK